METRSMKGTARLRMRTNVPRLRLQRMSGGLLVLAENERWRREAGVMQENIQRVQVDMKLVKGR
jgi:hypothetical protein